jgi:tryptophan-rich sensory protein
MPADRETTLVWFRSDLILLTGATGYVGGRLLRRLEARGDRVRCLVRRRDNMRERVAGRAWLEFEVESDGPTSSAVRQTAIYDPIGVSGRLYWYLIYPLHNLVFRGMLRGIVRSSQEFGRPIERPARSAFTQAAALAVFLLVCFGTAAVGAWLTSRSVATWYQGLAKPGWTPPDWVFGPVWSCLYLAMAVAGWLVWRQRTWSVVRVAIGLFGVQLLLNAAWSGLFFALRSPAIAFCEIVILWAAIAATTRAFWRISPAAGWLFVPYLSWSSFAAALNFAIWRMNS